MVQSAIRRLARPTCKCRAPGMPSTARQRALAEADGTRQVLPYIRREVAAWEPLFLEPFSGKERHDDKGSFSKEPGPQGGGTKGAGDTDRSRRLCGGHHYRDHERGAGVRVCPLPEDQELPLAHERAEFPRLP